jgi:hypothetical protein
LGQPGTEIPSMSGWDTWMDGWDAGSCPPPPITSRVFSRSAAFARDRAEGVRFCQA